MKINRVKGLEFAIASLLLKLEILFNGRYGKCIEPELGFDTEIVKKEERYIEVKIIPVSWNNWDTRYITVRFYGYDGGDWHLPDDGYPGEIHCAEHITAIHGVKFLRDYDSLFGIKIIPRENTVDELTITKGYENLIQSLSNDLAKAIAK